MVDQVAQQVVSLKKLEGRAQDLDDGRVEILVDLGKVDAAR